MVGSPTQLHSWWKKSIANPAGMIFDYVEHIVREHSQDADRMANGRKNEDPGARSLGWKHKR